MPFRISEQGASQQKIILLEDLTTGTKAEIYSFGALLNTFSVKQKNRELNVIEGFESPNDAIHNITRTFRSAKLSPFACRLKEGQYTFANKTYKTEKFYYFREALHGLLYDAVFTVTDSGATEDAAFVTLTYDYNKNDPGFPFFYRIQVMYKLESDNSLSITTKVTNHSREAIPMSDGWHPYFTFGKPVDNLTLFIDSDKVAQFDHKLLPTGHFLPYHEFTTPKKIQDTWFDNSFRLRHNRFGAACVLRDEEEDLQLSIYPDKNYPYLQVFIPEHRNSIAIENLSSLPDAFNNGIGLRILEPSESAAFATRFIIAQSSSTL